MNNLLILAQIESTENLKSLFREIDLLKILYISTSILFTWFILALIKWFNNWISEKVPRRFRLLIKQSLPFQKSIVLFITIAYLANLLLNLSPTNLLTLTGTIAVALGFAFKDYISSIIAGFVALFETPYRVGDRIKIAGHYGEVVGYQLRAIQLQTADDNLITIPHNKIWTESISNANTGHLEAQVATDFYFDHNVDVEKVLRILYQAAYSSRYTQLKLPVVVILQEHLWGTQFKLRAYPIDAREEFIYQTDLIRRAKGAFNRHNLPYPRLSPVVKSGIN